MVERTPRDLFRFTFPSRTILKYTKDSVELKIIFQELLQDLFSDTMNFLRKILRFEKHVTYIYKKFSGIRPFMTVGRCVWCKRKANEVVEYDTGSRLGKLRDRTESK